MNRTELDPTDLEILNLLQNNAALSHKEIAHKINRSLSATVTRVNKLEKSGFIDRYVALLNRGKIGKGLSVFVTVSLRKYHKDSIKGFRELVVSFEEVMECYQTSGDRDYIIKVVVSDMDEYRHFVQDKLASLPYIGRVQSIFVISEDKYETAFKL